MVDLTLKLVLSQDIHSSLLTNKTYWTTTILSNV